MTATLAPWQELAAQLADRSHDPAYASAPVLDAYARISRNPDTGEMEKTDRQLCDVLQNIAQRGARLGAILRDDNLSAWKKGGKRPAWHELLGRLTANTSNGVVCWHTDRLMRRMDDLEKLISLADTRGVRIGSCYGEYDLSSSDDRFTLRVLTAAAQKESDNVSRRNKRKHAARREAGRMNGGARRFGYPGKGADETQVAREREALAWAIESVANGTKSLSGIVAEFNARGLVSTRGNAFLVTTLRKMLTRASNAGLIEHGGAIVGRYKGVDPIVSEELWSRAMSALTSRKLGRPAEYELSGVLKCSLCGHVLVGNTQSKRGKRARTYRCPSPLINKNACGGPVSIMADVAESFVAGMVLDILSDPAHAGMVARQSAALAKVTAELDQQEALAVELSARLGEGKMTLARYDAAVGPVDARIATLTAERGALLEAGAGGGSARLMAREELSAAWAEATADERRALTKRAFPLGIAAYPGGGRWGGVPMAKRLQAVTREA